MAEAVGLGASIITFVAVATRLSKAAKDAWDSVKDAPEEIARVIHKLGNLEYLLNEILNHNTSTANTQARNRLTRLWTCQSNQLKRDFAIYQELADKLALQLKKDRGPISGARARFQWLIKQDTVRELDRRLQENIGTFVSILEFLTYDTVRSSSFDLQELRSVGARSAESITNLEPIIGQALTSLRSDISQSLQRALPLKPQAPKTSVARNPAGPTVSIRFDRWYTYELPLGTLRVTRGIKKLGWNKPWRYGPTSGSTDEETTSGIIFYFSPAPWLMAKAVTGAFVLHQRKYNGLPGLTHMISTANVLPYRHQALLAVEHGHVSILQGLFSKGLATPNDKDFSGNSLLHIAATKHHYEMCELLIREGADCNGVDNHGRTPLYGILRSTSGGGKDHTVALLNLLVNNGNDPTILSRHGISAFTHKFMNGMRYRLFIAAGATYEGLPDGFDRVLRIFDDFEEIDEFDPLPLTMSLCAVHSGKKDVAAKVEPAVKKWLKNHHKQGFINLGDAGALRVLAFQALQHRAPKLTTNQAEAVLQFAYNARCSADVIRALVRPGTVNGDKRWDDWDGDPLLDLAAELGDLEVVDILLDAGADHQANDLSAFESALMERHHHVVQRFLDRGVSSIVALNSAIMYGTLDLVKYFIERIPDVSARLGRRRQNRTVLFTAAAKLDMEKVKLLIESGIDVLARDTSGRTAASVKWRNKDISEYLKREEDKAKLKIKLEGIPDGPELSSPAVLAMTVSKRDPHRKLSHLVGKIGPDFEITEEVYQAEPAYHVLDSWGSLEVLTTEDVVLIASGLCVTLVGASYVLVANAIRFLWQNKKYATVRNVKQMGWFAGLMLSLACWIGYSAGKKR